MKTAHPLPFGVLELDKKGVIQSYNPVEGINPQLIIGKSLFDVISCEEFDYQEFTRGPAPHKAFKLSESAGATFLWLPRGALVIVKNTAPAQTIDRIVLEEIGEPKISIYQGRLIIT